MSSNLTVVALYFPPGICSIWIYLNKDLNYSLNIPLLVVGLFEHNGSTTEILTEDILEGSLCPTHFILGRFGSDSDMN